MSTFIGSKSLPSRKNGEKFGEYDTIMGTGIIVKFTWEVKVIDEFETQEVSPIIDVTAIEVSTWISIFEPFEERPFKITPGRLLEVKFKLYSISQV